MLQLQGVLRQVRGFAFEAVGGLDPDLDARVSPSEIARVLAALKGFREHVPRVVYDLYGSSASG